MTLEIIEHGPTLSTMEAVLAFLHNHQGAMAWISILSGLFFVVSLAAIPLIIARLPENYFVKPKRLSPRTENPRPLSATALVALKNVIGLLLVFAGILMLVLPGQGLITILIGLSLSNFPGKYRLERALVSKPAVFNGLNWIRRKSGKPPLQPPHRDNTTSTYLKSKR